MARVFVDTNVLFPFSLMDLMLALTEDAVHTVVWSDHLLEDWRSGNGSSCVRGGAPPPRRHVSAE